MKRINGRYTILGEIGESENSINYWAEDEKTSSQVVLKLINKNRSKPYPQELFRREYILQRQLSHPMIRRGLRFEPFIQMDGHPVYTSESLIVQEYLPWSFSQFYSEKGGLPLEASFSFQMAQVLRFLKTNESYHGDLKESNILFDENGRVVLADVSPLFHLKAGEADDLRALTALLIEKGLLPSGKEVRSLSDLEFLESQDVQWEVMILHQHLRTSSFPVHLLIPECSDFPRLYQWVHFYSPFSPDSAELFTEPLAPLYEVEGFHLWQLPDGAAGVSLHTLLQSLVEGLPEWEIIRPHRRFWEKISQWDESELMDAAVDFLGHLGALLPLALIIPRWELLDSCVQGFLIRLLDSPAGGSLKILSAGLEVVDSWDIFHYQVDALTFEELSRVLDFFFYHHPLEDRDAQEIFEMSQGIPALIKGGLRKTGEESALVLDSPDGQLRFSQGLAHLFTSYSHFSRVINTLSAAEKQVLYLVFLLGGQLPTDYLQTLSALEEARQALVEGGFLIESGEMNRLRHPHCYPLEGISLSPGMEKKLFQAMCGNLQELALSYFCDLAEALGEFSAAWDGVSRIFQDEFRTKPPHQALWRKIFGFFRDHQGYLSESQRRDLLWFFSRVLSDKELSVKKELLEEMNLLEKGRAASLLTKALVLEIGESPDLESELVSQLAARRDFHTVPGAVAFIGAALKCLYRKGSLEEGRRMAEELIVPALDRIDNPRERFELLRRVYPFFHCLGRTKEAKRVVDSMLDIVFLHGDELTPEDIFRGYNHYSLHLRAAGEIEESLRYNDMAYELALSRGYYPGLGGAANNRGLLLFVQGRPAEDISPWIERAMGNALLAGDYDLYFSSLLNEVELRLLNYRFSGVLELLSRVERYRAFLPEGRFSASLSLYKAFFYHLLGNTAQRDLFLEEGRFYFENRPAQRESAFFRSLLQLKAWEKGQGAGSFLSLSPTDLTKAVKREEALTSGDSASFRAHLLIPLFWQAESAVWAPLVNSFSEKDGAALDEVTPVPASAVRLIRNWIDREDVGDCDSRDPFFFPYLSLRLVNYYLSLGKGKAPLPVFRDLDFLVQALLGWKDLFQEVPPDHESSFLGTAMMKRWVALFKERGLNAAGVSFPDLMNELEPLIKAEQKRRLDEFWATKEFSPLLNDQELRQKTFRDVCALGGFQRGLYFEYDLREGWQCRDEHRDDCFFTREEGVIESLLEEVQSSRRDGLYQWENPSPGENQIVRAAAFPIVDITNSRAALQDKRASVSSANLLYHIKGIFYFDTKSPVFCPDEGLEKMIYFIREYINIAIYYNHLKASTLQDPLTGLLNRETWISMVRNRFPFVRAQKKVLAIIMIDVDRFKEVNDLFGRQAGDKVLGELARILMQQVRNVDLAGRLGGEEFMAALVLNKKGEAERAMSRIRRAITSAQLLKDYPLTVSMGCAFYPFDGFQINEVLEKADQALSAAKETGRDRIKLWSEVAHWKTKRRLRPIIGSAPREQEKVRLLLLILSGLDYSLPWEDLLSQVNDELGLAFGGVQFSLVRSGEGDDVLESWGQTPQGGFDSDFLEAIGERFHLAARLPRPGGIGCWAVYGVVRPEYTRYHLELPFFQLLARSFLEKIILAGDL